MRIIEQSVAEPTSFADAEVLTLLKHTLRFDSTDTSQDVYLQGCLDRAVEYLEKQNGINLSSRQVTLQIDALERTRYLYAPFGKVTATAQFGAYTGAQGQMAADYFLQLENRWLINKDQMPQPNGLLTVVYTAGITLSPGKKAAIADCAASVFNSGGESIKNTLSYTKRALVG